MKKLKGEVIKNNERIKEIEETYSNKTDFFIALVTISHELGVDVPIWTMKEDKLLQENQEVLIPLEKDTVLRIFV